MDYKVISSSQATLGEGISKKSSKSEIAWVDITGNKVHWKNLITGKEGTLTDFQLPSCTFSDHKGGMFISHVGGIDWVDSKYQNRQACTSWFSKDSGIRCNDGKMDKYGNIWISTMSVSHLENHGSIWFWDRKSKPILVVDNLTIPNSIAIDNLRNRFYFADSQKNIIYAGKLLSSRNQVNSICEFHKSIDGEPDGSTLDNEGNLWNARWGGSKIIKINSNSEVEFQLLTPFTRPTSCVFSRDEKQLFVTSALAQDDLVGGKTIMFNMKSPLDSKGIQ